MYKKKVHYTVNHNISDRLIKVTLCDIILYVKVICVNDINSLYFVLGQNMHSISI